MAATAAYDEIADWYDEYVTSGAGYWGRVDDLLRALLGRGTGGSCLDICCGTGVRAATLRELGWRPVGVDLSAGQLRHAAPKMPVLQADAARLPIRDRAVKAAVCVPAHTDVPDYAAVVGEAARVLAPGGVFVHIGVHPCFVGAFADRNDPAHVRVDASYHRRERRYDSFGQTGVRSRVGAWHAPLAELLHTALDAGLRIGQVREAGEPGAVPEILGFACHQLGE